MYNFVVLGQVPGTDITISFTMWLQLALVFAVAVMWYKHTHQNHKASPTTLGHPANVMVVRNGIPVPANEITL